MTDAAARVRTAFDAHDGGKVATVTLDNPGRLNALDSDLMDRLVAALDALREDAALRAVVLTGAGGRAFIAGADIREMSRIEDPEAARAFITAVHGCCHAIRRLPVPVIARIRGYVFGAGLEVAAACDLRVATRSSVFGMPEVRLGIPSVVEAALLPLLIGWGRTRELLLLGETIDAAKAQDWGLLERVVPDDGLDQAVAACLVSLMASPPNAIRLQKRLIREWEELPLSAAVEAGIAAFAAAYETPEPGEAMKRYLEDWAAKKRAGT